MHDLYDNNNDRRNIEVIWQFVEDADGDPKHGDFGKVDLRGSDRYSRVAGNDRLDPDGMADNYTGDARPCTDLDGEGCDAQWSEDYEVLFADGIFGCDTTRMVTISCEWDAQGELGNYTRRDHDPEVGPSSSATSIPAGATLDLSNAIKTAFEDAGATSTTTWVGLNLIDGGSSGPRMPGAKSAFVKCVAN